MHYIFIKFINRITRNGDGKTVLLIGFLVEFSMVTVFEEEFLSTLELTHQEDVLDVIKKGIIDDTVTSILEKTAEEVARRI